jgi:hypothetical protein
MTAVRYRCCRQCRPAPSIVVVPQQVALQAGLLAQLRADKPDCTSPAPYHMQWAVPSGWRWSVGGSPWRPTFGCRTCTQVWRGASLSAAG